MGRGFIQAAKYICSAHVGVYAKLLDVRYNPVVQKNDAGKHKYQGTRAASTKATSKYMLRRAAIHTEDLALWQMGQARRIGGKNKTRPKLSVITPDLSMCGHRGFPRTTRPL